MAYFRNKSKGEAAELNQAEPINPIPVDLPPPEMLADEDHLQREPEAPQPGPDIPEPPQPAPAPQPQPQAANPQDSDASEVLRAQMEALQRSEQLAHQRREMAAADQRRAAWLQATPAAQANYGSLGALHHEALRAGFDDLSEDYFRYLESGIEALAPPQQQPEPSMMPVERPPAAPDTAPDPEFFRPPPVRMPAPRSVAVSAPVSRTIPVADRVRIETNPNSVKLSPAELEIARSSGISPTEYARGKIRLEREKRDGFRQNG
jgi:hypothetical protein